MRPSRRRTLGVIGGLSLATVAGVVFKEKVIPPTPLLFSAAGSEAAPGDPAGYTGPATTDTPFKANGGSRLAGARVTVQAGARTRWHSHPRGELLIVMAGGGWVQDAGGPKRALAPGDTVWTAPGVAHWHGANRERLLSYVALGEPDVTGRRVDWGDPVDRATYRAAPGSLAWPPDDLPPAPPSAGRR